MSARDTRRERFRLALSNAEVDFGNIKSEEEEESIDEQGGVETFEMTLRRDQLEQTGNHLLS